MQIVADAKMCSITKLPVRPTATSEAKGDFAKGRKHVLLCNIEEQCQGVASFCFAGVVFKMEQGNTLRGRAKTTVMITDWPTHRSITSAISRHRHRCVTFCEDASRPELRIGDVVFIRDALHRRTDSASGSRLALAVTAHQQYLVTGTADGFATCCAANCNDYCLRNELRCWVHHNRRPQKGLWDLRHY